MSRSTTVVVAVAAALIGCAEKGGPGRPRESVTSADAGARRAAKAVVVGIADAGVRRHRTDDAPLRRPKSILLAEAREEIGWKVADGFLGREEIVDFVMEVVVDRQSLRAEVEQITDEALEEHRAREATWQYPTDPDRLDRAFAALEKEGVLARARFADCGSCATGELEALRSEPAKGRGPKGYVFFTEQDADGVSTGHALELSFGAFDVPVTEIGHRVVKALEKQGLHPEWSGDADQRIALSGLEWKKRRFTRPR